MLPCCHQDFGPLVLGIGLTSEGYIGYRVPCRIRHTCGVDHIEADRMSARSRVGPGIYSYRAGCSAAGHRRDRRSDGVCSRRREGKVTDRCTRHRFRECDRETYGRGCGWIGVVPIDAANRGCSLINGIDLTIDRERTRQRIARQIRDAGAIRHI